MGGGHVVGLEERFLRHLPIGANGYGFPPVMAHLTDCEILEPVPYGCDELVKGNAVWIEIDEHKSGKDDHLDFFQGHIAIAQLPVTKFLAFKHKLVLAVETPPPAVKRANN